MNQQDIAILVQRGIITEDKGKEIKEALDIAHEAKGSSRFKMILASLGALALGIGSLLFVALNWESIPDVIKLGGGALIIGLTLWFGYAMASAGEHQQVGKALLFLGALLVGGEMALVVQVYNLHGDHPGSFFLIWLVIVAPLVYATQYKAMTFMLSTLYFLTAGLYIWKNNYFDYFSTGYHLLFATASAMILFAFGSLHGAFPRVSGMKTIMRHTALAYMLVPLFFLTCEWVFPHSSSYNYYNSYRGTFNPAVESVPLLIGVVIALTIALIAYIKGSLSKGEGVFAILLSVGLLFTGFTFESTFSTLYLVFYNILFIGMLIYIIYYAVMRNDGFLLSLGLRAAGFYILIKYFQWLWDAMNAWLLFIIGGALLILGAMYFDSLKNSLTSSFKKEEIVPNI